MRYSLETIETLLQVERVAQAPKCFLTPETIREARYYYPPAPLTLDQLLADSQRYFTAILPQGILPSFRRVCFLFLSTAQTPISPESALILELHLPSPEARTLFVQARSRSSASETSSLKTLYPDVRAWLIGGLVYDDSTYNPVIQLLQTAYSQLHLQLQPLQPTSYANIALTGCILMILKTGTIGVIDVTQALQRYRQHCTHAVRTRLQQFRHHHGAAAVESLHHQFRVLFKYEALRSSREAYKVAQAASEVLYLIAAKDRIQKARIYYNPLEDIFPILMQLTLPPLVQLLQADSLEAWVHYLQQERQAQLKDVKDWEATFRRQLQAARPDGKTQATRGINHALHYVYQYSLIGLGAELTPWLGASILRPLWERLSTHSFTQRIQRWITPASLHTSCRWIGGGLGALGTYGLGGYWFWKSLLTGFLAEQWKQYVFQLSFNDENATLRLPQAQAWQTLGFMRCAALFIASLEAAYTKDFSSLLQAFGGIIGSVSAVQLAKQVFPGLIENSAQPLTEEQAVGLLFIGWGGYAFGSQLAGTVAQGLDKLVAREWLTHAFFDLTEEKELTGGVTDFSTQPVWSPSFWWHQKDHVRLGWTSQHTFQERSCEIFKEASGERTVWCDPPTLTPRLPLR